MQQVQGVVVPLVTPLKSDETIDRDGLRRLIDYMVAGSIDGIFVAGTTGEYTRLSTQQRHELFALTTEYCAGRAAVYAGVTDASIVTVNEHLRAAEKAGIDFCVAGLPFYFPVHTTSEAVSWFSRIIDSSKLPVLIYDIPGNAAAGITPEAIAQLATQIIGMKDSSGDSAKMKAFLAALGGENRKVAYLSGCEALAQEAIALGADGLVPSLGNVMPKLLAAIWEHRQNKEVLARLTAAMDKINALNATPGSIGSIAWKKRALKMLGVCEDTLSLPNTSFPEAENNRIQEAISLAESVLP